MTLESLLELLANELRSLEPGAVDRDQLIEAVKRAAERAGYREWEERMGDDL